MEQPLWVDAQKLGAQKLGAEKLGPLFFVIFINDLPGAPSPNSTVSMSAEDAKIYKDCVTLFDCLTLYDDIQALNDWFFLWQLKINLSKCEDLWLD